LISAGANVNLTVNYDGYISATHWAAYINKADLLKILVEAGALLEITGSCFSQSIDGTPVFQI
jgi:hypothetical protein